VTLTQFKQASFQTPAAHTVRSCRSGREKIYDFVHKVPLRPDNHTSVIRFLNTTTFHVFYVIYRCKITEIPYTTGENKILPEQYVLIAALVVYLNLQVPGSCQ
jgi:hypothetical protein